MNSEPTYYLGLDLGGTNLRWALYKSHRKQFSLEKSDRMALSEHAPHKVCDQIMAVITHLLETFTISAMGIGVAGMLSQDARTVLRAPNLDWTDFPLVEVLTAGLPFPVYLLNDLSAITWGEYTYAHHREGDSLLAVFMGTGIGGGLISRGSLLTGHHGVAGEIGHTKVVFDESARPCGCGKRGCIEAYLGGKNFIAWMEEELGAAVTPSTALTARQGSPHPGIVDAMARAYDSFSLSIIQRTALMLGSVLANAVTLVDPGVLLLGGTVWENSPLLRELTLKHYDDLVNGLSEATIVASALGDDAGIYGAARWAFSITEENPV
ncbi:ROK family protein [Myxococcota bacterium]|nr:ROK family protein [Myxococcota bacterium]MBU1538022.1 ROK family protein [Myxococcota bacterium]